MCLRKEQQRWRKACWNYVRWCCSEAWGRVSKSPKGKLFGEVGEGTGAVGTQHPTHGLFISFDVAETLLDVAFGR